LPSTGARSRIANLLLALAAVLLACLAVELFLRLHEPVSDVQVLREEKTAQGGYFALRPGVSGLVLGQPVTVNAAGYRGTLRPHAKPPGVTRVLVFGDSHTFSMGAGEEHTYPAIVESRLSARGARCEVFNFGVPGQDLRQILLLLRDRAFQYDPDVLLITFHSGDILESPDDVVPDARASVQGGTSRLYRLKVWLLQYSYLARLVIPYGTAGMRYALGWSGGVTYDEQREIEQDGKRWRTLGAQVLDLKRDLDRRGITLAFALFPSMLPFQEHPARRKFEVLSAWLDAHDIPAVNLLPAFSGQRAGQLTVSVLDKHPNEKGYAIAGDAVATFVAGLIERRQGAAPTATVAAPPGAAVLPGR
jgi:lysophospholipase L1-like esterase